MVVGVARRGYAWPPMTRSLTVPLPALRIIVWAVVALLAAIILLLAGARWGMRLVADPLSAALNGDLQEVHVSNGSIYLGRIVEVGGEEILLADPAVVRRADATEAAAVDYVVQALLTDPFGVGGPVAVERAQIVMIGSVDLDSALADAYQRAFAEPSSERSSPSP